MIRLACVLAALAGTPVAVTIMVTALSWIAGILVAALVLGRLWMVVAAWLWMRSAPDAIPTSRVG